MIDWERTKKETGFDKGYFEKYPRSGRKVFAICDRCGLGRWIVPYQYRDLCYKCAMASDEYSQKSSIAHKGHKHSEAHKKKISDTLMGRTSPTKGKPMSDEQKRKISEACKGRICTDENRRKQSVAMKGKTLSEEARRNISAGKQGIPYDEWEAFAKEQKYCPLFNEACREANRAKYNYECFICGLPQAQNITKTGKQKKLSVHHIDMDKNQGCDGHRWKLIPTCMKCHPGTHHEEIIARLLYLIKEV